jgi:hypothetical protein
MIKPNVTTVKELLESCDLYERVLDAISANVNVAGATTSAWEAANESLDEWVVEFVPRSNRIAGQCRPPGSKRLVGVIRLHRELFVAGREADRNQTFLHEVAHQINFYLNRYSYARSPHGAFWKRIMVSMGAAPRTCHSYTFLMEKARADREAKGHKHEYTCKDCGFTYKKMRALKHAEFRHHGACRHKLNGGRLHHVVVR